MSGLQKDIVQFKGNKVTINHKDYWMAPKSTNHKRTSAMSAAAAGALGFNSKSGYGGVMDWHKNPYGGQYIEVYAMTDIDAPMQGPRRCYVLYDRNIDSSSSDKKHFAASVMGFISIKNDKGYSSPPELDTSRPNIFSVRAIDNGRLKNFTYSARNADYA